LHVVDLVDRMGVEVGVVTEWPVQSDERACAGVLPVGRYAALTYIGHGRRRPIFPISGRRMKTRWCIELGIRPADA
jgi:hypothetical protein